MNRHLTAALILALCACSPPAPPQTDTVALASVASSATGGGTTNATDRSLTFTPGADQLLVVFASASGNAQSSPSMTDSAGGTYALVSRASWGTGGNMLAYAREQLTTGSSVTITLDTDTNTAAQLTALAYSGMTRTGASAIRQATSVADQPSGTIPALVLPAAVDPGNATAVAIASGDTTTTPPFGWTERHDASQATPTTALEVATRDSGFNCDAVAFQGTTSTGYAAMVVELDATQGPPPPDAGPDAPVPDAPDAGPDAPPPSFSVGAHGTVVQLYGTGHNPAQVTLDTEATGSTFLVAVGGKTSDITAGPTDNKGNTYSLVGANDFTDWPGYGSAVWKATGAGGTGHTWSQYVTAWDEDTTMVLEVKGAGSPTVSSTFTQHDNSGTYAPWLSGQRTLTAVPITTTGPALIVALWYGSGPASWGNHVATPDNGFTIVEGYGYDDPNGYIQAWMAYKLVNQAGTYGTTWTYQPSQGAELWMVAIQP